MLEHKTHLGSKFTGKYKLTCLLYYEDCGDIDTAIKREKQLKNWHREWKLNLIKEENPKMLDLSSDWYTQEEMDEFINNQDYI